MGKLHIEEKGLAIVEATLLLPFCMIMVIALYYVAIFMCQKANLQANLQNALIYYKNVESDTYVEASENMAYTTSNGTVSAVGGSYGETEYLFPYRFFGMKFQESSFVNFFRSMCGYMFFDTGSNVDVTAHVTNYVVYKEITATATQTVKPAISLSMVGAPDELIISCTSSVVISDADDFIRNTDFVIDVVEDTKIGEAASSLVDKAVEFYNKFKETFHVS
jgi:hypothetical protein